MLALQAFLGEQPEQPELFTEEDREVYYNIAKDCITELLDGAEPVKITVEKIFTAIYNKYNVPKDAILGTRRNKDIAIPRHIAIYLIRELTEMSYTNIAKLFNRDHATIMASHQKVRTDPELEADVNDLKKEILGS